MADLFKKSADFVFRFEKLFFHLKALQKLMEGLVNSFFAGQRLPEINAKKDR